MSPVRLAPDPADLARLLTGVHHDPHAILGAHEDGTRTVIRALRPHATAVSVLVGGKRHPMTHIDSGMYAVELPFTDLMDYRLEVSYPGGETPYTSPTATDSCRPSARSTYTCSPRAATNVSGRSSAPIRVPSPPPTGLSTECTSRCGRQMPRE